MLAFFLSRDRSGRGSGPSSRGVKRRYWGLRMQNPIRILSAGFITTILVS
jgi:hypothetical protein